jgi:hypothetical protein
MECSFEKSLETAQWKFPPARVDSRMLHIFVVALPASVCTAEYCSAVRKTLDLAWTNERDESAKFPDKEFLTLPSGLRRRSAVDGLLALLVRIPPGGIDVCLVSVVCATGLLLLQRSSSEWCVIVCDIAASRMRRRGPCWSVAPEEERFLTLHWYKVVQIWPGLFVYKQVTVWPGHIWTTSYFTTPRKMICGSQMNRVKFLLNCAKQRT